VQALRDPENGGRLRQRLADALQACHQRGEIHITARELRAALSYIFFGIHDCAELHENPDRHPLPYWQRAFDARSPLRQGELLEELTRFDPALEADPLLDRVLLRGTRERLPDMRRRAWFDPAGEKSVWLANGRHFPRFRDVPRMDPAARDGLMKELCLGIAHLEDLPRAALRHEYLRHGVPLKITPRTPIETALWVIKPWERFRLEAPLPDTAGLEALHTHLRLAYRYANGNEEVLLLGLELFDLLLELKDGAQLLGIAQEGLFANLDVFTQRLAREDARELHGWHPAEQEQVFRVRVEAKEGRLVLLRERV
jgi:hypothetical protein